ncbi:uncharacterized protein LOC125224889 [Leguminivora glycinivorella]|uniref:uncharacterized protein LOC125224889 n=1 Tax=Leguminivora glycinivorella TaxID=1035111 RepID=UPI00200BC2C1|nr:uncharacterized protein LOC125224889 [Leguminivora glycinivorella]
MRVRHFCPRAPGGVACYSYRGTRFDVAIDVLFTENCILDISVYGLHVNMSLLDIEMWKWEEGTYYEDFRLTPTEYRGPTYQTLDGFEPLDDSMWVPDYDRWSTEPVTYETTTSRYTQTANDTITILAYSFVSTTTKSGTTTKTRKKFSRKTKPPKGITFWSAIEYFFVNIFWKGFICWIFNC